jgi:hypothetical protein
LDLDSIRRHFGRRTFDRARQSYASGRLLTRHLRDEDTLVGVCMGSHGEQYEVEIDPSTMQGSCTCPVQYRCKHQGAMLLAFLYEPDTFVPEPAARGRRMGDAGTVQSWAEGLGVADLLDDTVFEVQPYLPWSAQTSRWQRYGAPPVREALTDTEVPITVYDALVQALQRRSQARQSAAAYVARASQWRDARPEEAALVPLWERARLWLVSGSARDVSRQGTWGHLEFDEASGSLLLKPHRGSWGHDARLDLADLDSGLDGSAVRMGGAVLDLLFGPGGEDLRAAVARFLSVPGWQRLIDTVDELLEDPVHDAEPDGWEAAWSVQLSPLPDPMPVWRTPYKRKEGFRTKKRTARDPVELPVEDRAAAVLVVGTNTQGRRNHALDSLVGHPRVLGPDGLPARVARGVLSLAVEDEGALGLVPHVEGRAVPVSQRLLLVDAISRQLGTWWDLDRRTLWVLPVAPKLGTVLRTFSRGGWALPAEAKPALLGVLERLEERVPLELEGAMRGEQVPASVTPVVQLETLGEGMRVEVFVRPLPQGPLQRPGEGPRELARVDGGKRQFVVRGLSAEVDAVRERLAALELPVDRWGREAVELDTMLDLVGHLQELGEDVVVEWPRQRARVLGSLGAQSLSVRATEGRDWFGVEGEVRIEGSAVELGDLLDSIRRGRRFIRVKGNSWARITDRLKEQLGSAAFLARKDGKLPPLAVAPALGPLADDGAQIDLPEATRKMVGRIQASADLHPDVPHALQAELRHYQEEGYRWLMRTASWSPGAVLADDMGLGKTVQALAVLLARADEGPALVVAPASVNVNWQREAARFAPSLRVSAYRGGQRAKMLEDLGPGRVLVTSYDLVTRDQEALAEVAFGTVVLDEAQAIKNAVAQRSRATAGLNAGFMLALTGTPVENHIGEVWSLFRTVAPGLLGSARHFTERFVRPERSGYGDESRMSLGRLVRAFVLRRTKQQVATELPDRVESVVYIELGPEERRRYDELRRAAIESMEEGESQMKVLAALTRLRQLACATRLVYDDGPERSTKIARLVEMVVAARESGERSLVFSDFVGLLKLARAALEAAGLTVRMLDGSMPVHVRQREVDAFQDGDGDVFLISRGAGGTGLNLTAASTVFHLDPWWNPAREDQATDRAHRIGQERTVTVYRLVSARTIEEEVLSLHETKRELASSLLSGAERTAKLGADELLALLRG